LSKFSVTYSTSSTVPTLGISGCTPTIIHLNGAHTDFAIHATRLVKLTFHNLVSIIICEGYILQSSSLRNFLIVFYDYDRFKLLVKKKYLIKDRLPRLLFFRFNTCVIMRSVTPQKWLLTFKGIHNLVHAVSVKHWS